MRVIAGLAKGVRLSSVPSGTRPVSDRAREGVFSSLGERVRGAAILDLYAGTGAMGIEALSRGAERAWFIDQGLGAVRAVRENLELAGLARAAAVLRGDVRARLRRGDLGPPEGVGIAFADPPYATPEAEVLEMLELLRA
ncbi:MAG: RsmD family RNA methyltransferase, partial [Actinobacteria bacterium]|nr:RsmD family RNA methyltransferase [Actinomycetota bacterium]